MQRSYAAGVGGTFLVGNNCSYYPLQKANPRGESHVLSGFDKIRKKYVMRQFHLKGFVQSIRVNRSRDRWKKLVWTTESIENVPARCARETYVIADQNEFRELSELAEPRKDFMQYTQTHFKRAPSSFKIPDCPNDP